MVFQAGSAGETLLNSESTRNAEGGFTDLRHFRRVGHGVDQLVDGTVDDLNGEEENKYADDDAADMIGDAEATRVEEGEKDGSQSNEGRKQVGDVVPGIGFERGAGDALGGAEFQGGERGLENDGGGEWI